MADMIDTSTEAVKALLHGVTAGPWTFEREAEPEDEHPRHFVCHPLTECDATTVCNLEPSRAETEAQRNANARFIAAARDLVPALLSERDDLRAKLDAAVDGLRKLSTLAPVEKPPEPYDENGWQVADTGERHAQMVLEKDMWSVADFARAAIAKIKEINHE